MSRGFVGLSFRDLSKIIFRIVGVRRFSRCSRISNFFFSTVVASAFVGNVIAFIVITVGIKIGCVESRFIATAPIVFQFPASPTFLEFSFSGVLCGRIIEIPRIICVYNKIGGIVILQSASLRSLVCKIFLARGSFRLFFFFFLEVGYYFLYHFHALFGRHSAQTQKRVLEGNVSRVYSQLVENIASALEHIVVFKRFWQQGHGLGIARLR